MNQHRISTASGSDLKVEYRLIPGLAAVVTIETQSDESIASLNLADVDDIFGIGSVPSEAVESLRLALQDAQSNLAENQSRLTPRLSRQLAALEMLATYTEAPAKIATDSRVRDERNVRSARMSSSAAAFSRRFEG